MRFTSMIVAATAAFGLQAAQAATSLYLEAATPTVVAGGLIDVGLFANIDLEDQIIGFGFDWAASPNLTFVDFVAGPKFADDLVYLAPYSDADGIRGAVEGDLLFGAPVSGPGVLLGTFKVLAGTAGQAFVGLGADDLSFSYTEGLIPLDPMRSNFMPSVIAANFQVTPVPEPLTRGMMAIGLALVGWRFASAQKQARAG